MKRIRGGTDVWWWDEQPIYEATRRRAIAAGKRRMRRDDAVHSGQDLAALFTLIELIANFFPDILASKSKQSPPK